MPGSRKALISFVVLQARTCVAVKSIVFVAWKHKSPLLVERWTGEKYFYQMKLSRGQSQE